MCVSCLVDFRDDPFVKKALATVPSVEGHESRHPGVIKIKNIADTDPFILQPIYKEDAWRNLRRIDRLRATCPFGRAGQRLPGKFGRAIVVGLYLKTGVITNDYFPAYKVHSILLA